MAIYARVVVKGSPISKSNFKLSNKDGRSILPTKTGTYHDRYYDYEEAIVIAARSQNPQVTFTESLIAVLKVYYKSEKRHPDTNNITKSIFDGIEKSGLIVNDAQVRRLIIEEYYDKENPRFELELFPESIFMMSYEIKRHDEELVPIEYGPPPTRKRVKTYDNKNKNKEEEIKKELVKKRANGSSLSLKEVEDYKEKLKAGVRNSLENLNISRAVLENRIKGNNPLSNKTIARATPLDEENNLTCSICKKKLSKNNYVRARGGKEFICKKCLKDSF